MWMIRWMCGYLKERQPSTELRMLGAEAIGDVIVMRRHRLRWHGDVERKDDADYVKACTMLVVEGTAPVGRPRKMCPLMSYREASSVSNTALKLKTNYECHFVLLCTDA